eukprot:Gb_37789 [translate_table: standard]
MSRTCRACTQKCCTSHSNRTLSLNGLSFFKVMMGNFRSHLPSGQYRCQFGLNQLGICKINCQRYSDGIAVRGPKPPIITVAVLEFGMYHLKVSSEIPSHCANQIQSQGCKDAILEGPSGYLWHVILCCTGASSCFRDGWENFVSDNSIEADDVLVVRHVIDTHFLVQIFGSCGYEKQSTFTIENHGSCCLKKEDLSIICNQRWCGHKEKTTNASVFLENNFVVEQKRSENIMRIKNLTPLQNENSSNIRDIEEMDMGILPSKGKQVHIAEASYTEACISNDSPESLDNHVLLTPPKIDIKHAIRLPKSRCQVSGNQVGLCAEQPIVLDDEEDLSAEASSAYTRDLATVEACDHSGFEVLQEKPLGVGKF